MSLVEDAIATLGIPGSIAVVLVIIFAILQLIGEFIEAAGKVAPTALKLRKLVTKRKQAQRERENTLNDVKNFLQEVKGYYDADNIAKRDAWMAWVNERATVYDNTIVQYHEKINNITEALNANTRMTEHMFVEQSRDRIIDFATKITNSPLTIVSREEFNRIFRIYEKYEEFLAEHNMTNGEVDINMDVIRREYVKHLENHSFMEDMRTR